MESRVIRIGSSLGLIIPKVFANEFGFHSGTPLSIDKGEDNLIISKCKSPRSGWGQAFCKFAADHLEEELLPDCLDTEADALLTDGEKI